MHKVLIVAKTEFASAVRSKAFLASLVMLPMIYGLMFLVQRYSSKSDVEPRKFAVIDQTGKLYPAIEVAAKLYNKDATKDGKLVKPEFLPEEFKLNGQTADEAKLALSERVRSKDLYAFILIPKDAGEPKVGEPVVLNYYTLHPNYRDLTGWLDEVVGTSARVLRYQAVGVNPMLIVKIDRPTFVESLGLVSRAAPAATGPSSEPGKPGAIVGAKKNDMGRSFFLPLGLSMIVFVVTLNVGPQLMSTVMEEKMSRISEMLLGSLSTFQLMLGKLIGNAATAMLTTALYLAGAYFAAYKFGMADTITPALVATLLLYVAIAIFLFGSLFMAVGSACSDMKDAQSLMMPVMMLSMMPMFFMFAVLITPDSRMATISSLIPFATPMLMTMRMAMPTPPPTWQVLTSIGLTLATAIACVAVSAKIFRTGLLMHGKAPTFQEMAKWVMTK